MKNFLIIIIVIIIAGSIGVYILNTDSTSTINLEKKWQETETVPLSENQTENGDKNSLNDKSSLILGKSAGGRDIPIYQYGDGEKEILFIGGIHGGYEWNTSLLSYEAIDYLKNNPEIIPENLKITIIPVLNPDGLNKVVGTYDRFQKTDVPANEKDTIVGRFNSNEVDLNRNFDCDWKSTGVWQNKTVSGGEEAFSEPESQALKNYIETQKPQAVIVWYSAAGGVYASSCHKGILRETDTLAKIYAEASAYPSYNKFDSYEITGDMVNWLAKIKIPAISVLLTNHSDTEWDKNKAGIDAVLKYYSK